MRCHVRVRGSRFTGCQHPWKPEAVRITREADNTGTYNKAPRSYCKWGKTRGGHIFTEHPGWGLSDVYAAVIRDFPYHAGFHVNYQAFAKNTLD